MLCFESEEFLSRDLFVCVKLLHNLIWEIATTNKIIQLFFTSLKFPVGGTIAANSNGNSKGNSFGMSTSAQNIHAMVSRFGININSWTNDKVRSKTLSEASDETMVNLMVGYKKSRMKAVNSSNLVVSWVHR